MEILDFFRMALALGVGALLGLFYFAGLWVTVSRLPDAKNPALLTLGSFLLRTLIALAGFYLLMAGSVFNLLASLAGFILARTLTLRFLNREKTSSSVS